MPVSVARIGYMCLGVKLLLACPLQAYSPAFCQFASTIHWYLFVHVLGGEKNYENKVFCQRPQHNDLLRGNICFLGTGLELS